MKFYYAFIPALLLWLVSQNTSAQSTATQDVNLLQNDTWEQVAPKLKRKWLTGNQSTFAYWKMDEGAHVPRHQHPNEQTTYIQNGSVRVLINGTEHIVKAGGVLIIPANTPHEFFCLEDGTVDIDFFAPPRADWINGTADYLKTAAKSDDLEIVGTLNERPGDVAVSAEGRVFATIHPLGSKQNQLVEIINGKPVPYPSSAYQKNGQTPSDKKFDAMLGLIFDKKDRLWVTDMGLDLGRSRIWVFDIKKNKVIKKIEIPTHIAPSGSFLQDIVVDEKNNWAFLADIANPGIIALDLSHNTFRRFGNHPALQAEDKDMIIDNEVVYFGGKPARVAIDPITLSPDRETLFFGAMNGSTWYKLPTRLFREKQNDRIIDNSITVVGTKPYSDGAFTDPSGNHYFTNLQEHAITRLDTKGKLTHMVQNSQKLQWPDNAYLGPDSWVYISVNHLNTTPAFTGGADKGKPPYYIYKFRLNTTH